MALNTNDPECYVKEGECPWWDWGINEMCEFCTKNNRAKEKRHDYSTMLRSHGY